MINGQPITKDSTLLYNACTALLRDTTVEGIVILADDSFIRTGLPTDEIDTLVLTSTEKVSRNINLVNLLSRNSRQMLTEKNSRTPWSSLRHQLYHNHHIEAGREEIAELLLGVLSGSE